MPCNPPLFVAVAAMSDSLSSTIARTFVFFLTPEASKPGLPGLVTLFLLLLLLNPDITMEQDVFLLIS